MLLLDYPEDGLPVPEEHFDALIVSCMSGDRHEKN